MSQAFVLSVDSAICREVTSLLSCTLDEPAERLPVYSWAQMFAAVDRLSQPTSLRLLRTS
ncbi:MAG TPA: hypothetical protein VIW47_15875 [Nitrospiraceae bacterium]|jgi:hypothetical protein